MVQKPQGAAHREPMGIRVDGHYGWRVKQYQQLVAFHPHVPNTMASHWVREQVGCHGRASQRMGARGGQRQHKGMFVVVAQGVLTRNVGHWQAVVGAVTAVGAVGDALGRQVGIIMSQVGRVLQIQRWQRGRR